MNKHLLVLLLMVAIVPAMGCVLENGSELPNGQSVSENCTRCECQSGTLDCGPDAAQDVDGQWSTWTQWSNCSKDCRKYNKIRYRICGSPEAECNGATCVGDAQETEPCQRSPCPCVLGNGTELPNGQSLSENCIKCECKNGILDCGPDAAQDVDGQWSTWTQWSNCSKDCRKYNKIRYRICGSPEAECNGATCVGDAQETEPCQRSPCPCVLGNGTELPNGQSLSENCIKCECKNGTLDCGPDAAQDVDGQWSTWTQWSNCSKDCRKYNKIRYRICGSPEAECNGATCVGDAQETEPCQRSPCPCVLGNGTELPNGQSLSENCIKCECKNGTLDCGPDAAQDVDGQWSTWTKWSNCSKDYRNYNRTRYRICGSPEAECNGATCVGDAQETEPCQSP